MFIGCITSGYLQMLDDESPPVFNEEQDTATGKEDNSLSTNGEET